MFNIRYSCSVVLVAFLAWPFPHYAASTDEELTLGVFPRRSVEATTQLFTPIADYLSNMLGRTVRLEVRKDFETFWQDVSKRRYHIVHYNQYQYVRSHKEYGYEVIVKNEEFGKDTLASALVVRKDSGIKNIDDLRGKKIVFGGGPTAMVSYIMNTHLLRQAGLQEGDYQVEYAVSPPNAVYAAFYGHAAAGGAGNVVLSLPSVNKRIKTDELSVLATSAQLTHIPWAVRSDLDKHLKTNIQNALVGLNDSEKGRQILKPAGLTALIKANDEEYDVHREIIWQVLGENYCVRNCDTFASGTAKKATRAPLVVGIFPRRAQKLSAKLFQPMMEHIGKQLGRPVRLDIRKDFPGFWSGVVKKEYDIVHYNQYHYVKSHKLYGYDILLKNEEQKLATLTPCIWVRKDRGINNIQGLRGKKIIFGGGKTAMLTYIGPTYLLRQAGLKDGEYEEAFAINPLAACRAMFLGQADACGSGTIMMKLPLMKKSIDTTKVKTVAVGSPITHLSWAVKGNMPAQLRTRIQRLMVGLKDDDDGKKLLKQARMTALLPANDRDYDDHRRIIEYVFGEKY